MINYRKKKSRFLQSQLILCPLTVKDCDKEMKT